MTPPFAVSFFVSGHPEEKGNHAAHIVPIKGASASAPLRKRCRGYIFDKNDKKLKQWQRRIELSAIAHRPDQLLTGPVRLDVRFVFSRPKTVKRTHHTVAPDRDKLLRAVQDALQGVIYVNDSQVVAGETTKQYGALEGATIEVSEIGQSFCQLNFTNEGV